MAQTYNKLIIDVNQRIDDIVTAKQSDTNSRFLDVVLYDGSLPVDLTGHSVKIYFKKPDNTEVFTEGQVTDATAGRCQFELTSQTLAAYGNLQAEISLWDGGTQVLTTQTFTISVLELLRSDNTVESTNEFGVLVTLFQNIHNSLDIMNTIIGSFGSPGSVAEGFNATTFWAMMEPLATKTQEAINYDVIHKIGSKGDTPSSNTVFGELAALPYKSIQRGYFVCEAGNNVQREITINEVNPLKCFVLLNSLGGDYANNRPGEVVVKALTSTKLTLITCAMGAAAIGRGDSMVSWQVIESR